MKVVYEQTFDWNEWFVIILLFLLHFIMVKSPKIFSRVEGIAHYLYGITIVFFFDHTTSTKPWDLYDVNDTSGYQLMDFLYYLMNGPFSYFFVYVYAKLNIRGYQTLVYLVIWSAIAVLTEWVGLKIGLFHYDKGYKMYWSFSIYLTVQIVQLVFFHCIKRTEK